MGMMIRRHLMSRGEKPAAHAPKEEAVEVKKEEKPKKGKKG